MLRERSQTQKHTFTYVKFKYGKNKSCYKKLMPKPQPLCANAESNLRDRVWVK